MWKLVRVFILVIIFFIVLVYAPPIKEEFFTNDTATLSGEQVEKEAVITVEIQEMIGMNVEEIMKQYGMPTGRYPSLYGYEWWVFFEDENPGTYFQVGIENDEVVTVYIIGEDIATTSLRIGDSYGEVQENYQFSTEVSFTYNGSDYVFSLSEQELIEQPLVQLESGIWAQMYFDTFKNTLSSVRFMSTEVLLMLRPYDLSYTNALIERPQLTDEERRSVEIGEEQMIFDLTNIMRVRFNLPTLTWDNTVAEIALSHSKDMEANGYFDHTSPTYGDLGQRLQREDISYSISGENIIANYIDAMAAVEGWMNSEGHRENILREEFTSIGVGVYNKYYTQNFIGANNSY